LNALKRRREFGILDIRGSFHCPRREVAQLDNLKTVLEGTA